MASSPPGETIEDPADLLAAMSTDHAAPPRRDRKREPELGRERSPDRVSEGPVSPPADLASGDDAEGQSGEESSPPLPPARPIPIRPVTPGADDALLTPRELAAAFRLDFSPPRGRSRGGSKWSKRLLAVVLIGGGLGALLSLRPDVRARAGGWAGGALAAAKGYYESWKNRKPAAAPPTVAAGSPQNSARPATPAGTATKPATRPRPIVIAPPKPAPLPPQPVAVEADAPDEAAPLAGMEPDVQAAKVSPKDSAVSAATRPGASEPRDSAMTAATTQPPRSAPAVAQSSLWQQSLPVNPPAPGPATRPVASAARPSPAPPRPPVVSPTTSIDTKANDAAAAQREARRLLSAALDAEGNQDYVEAVRCYEAIKRLPVDARAMGVELRLERARKLAR
jgi:hypothetical protein